MCGIFGAYDWSGGAITNGPAMADALKHRGPNAEGIFQDAGIMLGNRRLSIIDLSEASNQPIISDDGDIVLVQNGEIYNYIELRDTLRCAGHVFKTDGDTEVLLRAFLQWGPGFVARLNGMFSIAVYRISTRQMWLYRDRLGVKPLYLAGDASEGRLWFASEIKSILTNGVQYTPNLEALAQFFALNYVPAPNTIFEGITHLPPGSYASVAPGQDIKITRYWDLAAISPNHEMTPAEGKAELVRLLDDATRIRMRADAPFGAFLSGGLDSASVVGFMSLYQSDPVSTYSIGFVDPRFDETVWARRVATRFGTFHQTQVVSPDIVQQWPRFIRYCDQPHGDMSFIPTDILSALAARDVRMVLTGDGGDELFAGYEKYLDVFPGGRADHLKDGWEDDFVRASGLAQDDQAHALLAGDLHSAFHDTDPYAALRTPIQAYDHQDPINRVLMAETQTLLPGNNLVKPDRMAMANGLEVRSPLLDYRMVEFAFSMPGHMKLTGGRTKAIYKEAMVPLLGRDITDRKKQMFTVPIGDWFRDALTQYCREVLLDGRLEARGLFHQPQVKTLISEHISGNVNHTRILRALISTELWFRLFEDRSNEDLLVQAG